MRLFRFAGAGNIVSRSPGLWLCWLLLLAGCASVPRPAPQRFEFTQPQMGAPFRIVLYASDEPSAQAAAAAAFARVQGLNAILSDYDYDSELSQLSRTSGQGRAVKVSNDLWTVLAVAEQFSEQSSGAFDVTVGPVVALWRKARREKKFPEADRLESARAGVGYQKVKLDARNRTVELLAKNMRLDLGGIAKGYAVDETMKVLKKHGVKRAFVAAAGDMLASQSPPGKEGWKIELTGPAKLGESPASAKEFVLLKNAALTTSGDTFQFVELAGRRYSHIVDPRTGVGLTDHSLVTTIARDCMTADALATAISVMAPEAGLGLTKQWPGAAARILRAPGGKIERHESRGFRCYVFR